MFFRTDMAVERRDVYKAAIKNDNIDGIESYEEIEDEYKLTFVKITNENGEKAIGKKQGDYITIDLKRINQLSEDEERKIINKISDVIKELLKKNGLEKGEILVVGLGNLFSVPDSLGNKVVQNIEITRHVKIYLPDLIDKNVRSISAISPGVLGTTGIETFEIVEGVKNKIKPAAIIVIDSLCSKSIERLNKSIQISDTGIIPGGGVDNARQEISKETLGIPVITIGVPTVVDAASLVIDTINMSKMDLKFDEDKFINEMKLNDFNFIVTFKEIDELIENMVDIISEGINNAL